MIFLDRILKYCSDHDLLVGIIVFISIVLLRLLPIIIKILRDGKLEVEHITKRLKIRFVYPYLKK